MNLTDLCSLCGQYEIVDTKSQLDKDYYSYSNIIYSDGHVKSHINSEGYIHITNVENADYIMFIGIDYSIYLGIYHRTPDTKYKEIIDNLNKLKKISSEILESKVDNDKDTLQNTDLVDINTFTCIQCGSNKPMKFTRNRNNNPDALHCKCDNCKSEYTLVPSKFYRISSKKIVYFKSDESRNIQINEK